VERARIEAEGVDRMIAGATDQCRYGVCCLLLDQQPLDVSLQNGLCRQCVDGC
jgi:hypothetical protein